MSYLSVNNIFKSKNQTFSTLGYHEGKETPSAKLMIFYIPNSRWEEFRDEFCSGSGREHV